MTALDQLTTLAELLTVRTEQRRLLGDDVVCLAGTIGHLKPDGDALVLHLRRSALSSEARAAAREALDAGLIQADAGDRLLLARMPRGDFECNLLRDVLGLYPPGIHRRSAA